LKLNKNKIFEFFIGEDWLAKNNPLIVLIILGPASIIASLVSIPLMVLNLPFLLFNQRIRYYIRKILLYIQHSVSLCWPYLFEEYLFGDFQFRDILVGSLFAFFAFYRSIRSMVNETLDEFGV